MSVTGSISQAYVTLIFVINVAVSPTPNDDVAEKSFLREQTAESSALI